MLGYNDDIRKFPSRISRQIRRSQMPNVKGKKYPYTAAGMKAAAKARKKAKAKPKAKSRRVR